MTEVSQFGTLVVNNIKIKKAHIKRRLQMELKVNDRVVLDCVVYYLKHNPAKVLKNPLIVRVVDTDYENKFIFYLLTCSNLQSLQLTKEERIFTLPRFTVTEMIKAGAVYAITDKS